MNKILGVIVLGMLLSGNAYAESGYCIYGLTSSFHRDSEGKKYVLKDKYWVGKVKNRVDPRNLSIVKCDEEEFISKAKYETQYKKIKKLIGPFKRAKSIPLNSILTSIKGTHVLVEYNKIYESINNTQIAKAEPSLTQKVAKKEERRLAEETRKKEERRLAEETRKKEERRLAEEKRKKEERRLAEEKRKKEERRLAEEKRKKEERRLAEEKRKNEEIFAASSGSGFFVSKSGHIISNYHVIEGCNKTKLTFKGKQVDADILAVDRMNDLAILKANLIPNQVYSVSTEDAALLEDLIIAGYPLGKKVSAGIKTSKGSVTALAGYGDNYSEFQTDAALNQGNSGGPIMNQKGNVIGVAVANFGKKAGVESFNFGIKSSTLKTFASANGLTFLPPNNKDLSNKDLGKLITEATVYLECHMTVAKIKIMIAEANNQKAFFSEFR